MHLAKKRGIEQHGCLQAFLRVFSWQQVDVLQTILGIPEDNIINKKTPEQKKFYSLGHAYYLMFTFSPPSTC